MTSSNTMYYPSLDLQTIKNLQIVKDLMLEHKDAYFLEGEYNHETEQLLQKLFTQVLPFNMYQSAVSDKELNLIDEVENLFKLMRDAKEQLGGNSSDIQERMTYFKTLSTNLEKIITLKQQALGIKEIHDFHQAVINVMEDVLTGAQRTEVINRLKIASGNKSYEISEEDKTI